MKNENIVVCTLLQGPFYKTIFKTAGASTTTTIPTAASAALVQKVHSECLCFLDKLEFL